MMKDLQEMATKMINRKGRDWNKDILGRNILEKYLWEMSIMHSRLTS